MNDDSEMPFLIENGKIEVLGYDEALRIFLEKKGCFMTSRQIAKEIGIPYSTIHYRLVKMAEKGLIEKKVDHTPKTGRKPLLFGPKSKD